MKLSTKIILPIILISALLILLAGCFGVPADESPETTTTGGGTITGIIAAPCCYTLGEPLSGTSGSPEYWCYWCEKDWYLQGKVEVILTSGQVEIATTTTDEFGVYTFTDVPPGENFVITAYCPDKEMPLVMDVVPKLTKNDSFDAGTTDLVSTSLGLVVDYVTYFAAWDPEDISLNKVIAAKPNFEGFPKFQKLIREVRRVLENCEDVDEDDELLDVLCRAAEEVSESDMDCAPGFTPVLEAEEDPGPGPGPTPGPVTYTLTTIANPTAGGTVTGGGTYNEGTVVTVTATPADEGWYFFEWSGNLSGSANPTSILMNGNKSVTAHFTEEDLCADNTPPEITAVTLDGEPIESPEYLVVGTSYEFCVYAADDDILSQELTYSLTITNGGTTIIPMGTNSDGFICFPVEPLFGDVGTYEITVNVYDGCENGTDTWGPFTVVVEPIQHSLNLIAGPGGSVDGTVNGLYDEGTIVGIDATPDQGYEFTGWTANLGSIGNVLDPTASSTDVIMNEDMELIANFTLIPPIQHSLNLIAGPGGSVDGTVNGLYDEGTIVGIDATPDQGYEFTGWTANLGSIGNVLDPTASSTDVIMNEDMELIANFTLIPPIQHSLNLIAGPGGSVDGTVNGLYDEGTIVGIDATPDQGYEFTGWTANLGSIGNVLDPTASSTDVIMNEDMELIANFTLIPPIQHSLNLIAGPGGSVDGTVNGLYDEGTIVGIDATPDQGYEFTGWTANLGSIGNVLDPTASSTDVIMNEDMELIANFVITNVVSSIVLEGFNGNDCHGPGYLDPVELIPGLTTLEWLKEDNPNCKSVHFTVDFYGGTNIIDYRYTTDINGTAWDSDTSGPITGYSFTSACIIIPMVHNPPEEKKYYATALDIEIDVNGVHTYTIYLRIPPSTP